MKKSDLKYGNVVETREGIKYLYHCTNSTKLLNLDYDAILWIRDLDENLKSIDDLNEFDIMKVYKDYTCKELLWERKEKPKLTEDEKVILRNLSKNYKYIVRTEIGDLWIYSEKPKRFKIAWLCYIGDMCGLFAYNHLFQFIQWEDEEPYLIEDLLEERGNN